METEKLISSLTDSIVEKKADYQKRQGRKEQLLEDKSEKKQELTVIKNEIKELEKVNLLLQQTAEYAREQARQQMEYLVTKALQIVFGDKFSFEIELSKRRNQASAEFYVVSEQGGKEIRNTPQDSRGGGVVDVVSLALRVAMLLSYNNPPLVGPLVLDEPAKHVSGEYIKNVTNFLKEVNQISERQIIVITHQQHLSEVADKAFQVELDGEASNVTTSIMV